MLVRVVLLDSDMVAVTARLELRLLFEKRFSV